MSDVDASWPNVPAIVHNHDAIEGRLDALERTREVRLTSVESDVTFIVRMLYVLIAVLVAVIGLIALAWVSTPTAAADPIVVVTNPADVHWPQYSAGWCPGGRGGFIVYWCDGRPYADNTQWHFDTALGMRCVLRTGEVNPPDAMPGGCGGGW